jgi:hypothetical protein
MNPSISFPAGQLSEQGEALVLSIGLAGLNRMADTGQTWMQALHPTHFVGSRSALVVMLFMDKLLDNHPYPQGYGRRPAQK